MVYSDGSILVWSSMVWNERIKRTIIDARKYIGVYFNEKTANDNSLSPIDDNGLLQHLSVFKWCAKLDQNTTQCSILILFNYLKGRNNILHYQNLEISGVFFTGWELQCNQLPKT